VVASLDAEVKGKKRQLAKARTEAAALERVLRELERAAVRAQRERPVPDQTPAIPSTGKPLGKGRWPVPGQMLADFGQSRAGGKMRWDGVLIAAPAGTEVRAIRPGRVVYADWLPGLGLLMVLDHGDGYLSLYGHNQDLTRQVGDRLADGDVFAHVGDTGGQARPALYFEVRRNGRPVNPRQWSN
jgi:septal ring factor EnvC (AmiA/AmiB activator)